MPRRNDSADTMNPKLSARRNGAVENEMMPSRANESILRNGNFDFPPWHTART